jgi:hypothetical protein
MAKPETQTAEWPAEGREECSRIGFGELCADGAAQAIRLERDSAGAILLADGRYQATNLTSCWKIVVGR